MIRPAPPDHVGDPVESPSVVNVPNGLTVLRLLLVPVFAWLLLRDGGVRVTGWTAGDFAAWIFSDPAIPNLPARVLVFDSRTRLPITITSHSASAKSRAARKATYGGRGSLHHL